MSNKVLAYRSLIHRKQQVSYNDAIIENKCKNSYKNVLTSWIPHFLLARLKNKCSTIVAIPLTGRWRSIIENMAVMALTDNTMVFDARTE